MDENDEPSEKTEKEQVAEFHRKLSEKYGTAFDEPVTKRLKDLIYRLRNPDPERAFCRVLYSAVLCAR